MNISRPVGGMGKENGSANQRGLRKTCNHRCINKNVYPSNQSQICTHYLKVDNFTVIYSVYQPRMKQLSWQLNDIWDIVCYLHTCICM